MNPSEIEKVKNWGKLVAAVMTNPTVGTDLVCIFDRNDLQTELLAVAAELCKTIHPQPHVAINGRATYEAREGSWGCAEWTRILWQEHKIPKELLLAIEPAQHSGEEAERFVDLCIRNAWKRVTIMAPPYYLPRCFLSMLGVMRAKGVELQLDCRTLSQMRWEEYTTKHAVTGGVVVKGTRFDHLDDELDRILAYRSRYEAGDVAISPIASIRQGVEYLERNRA